MGSVTTSLLEKYWFRHRIEIRRSTGNNATTPGYGQIIDDDELELPAFEETHARVVDEQKVVNAGTEAELVSTTQVHVPVTTLPVPTQSLVTLPEVFGGRELRVVGTAYHHGGGAPTPDYMTIYLG